MTRQDDCPVMGMMEAAELIGKSHRYFQTMRYRHIEYRQRAQAEGREPPANLIPEEDWIISGRTPVWLRETMIGWAKEAGWL
jgi:hypothetical protein